MEIKTFIENFVDQFEDTDASVFTAETKYRELDEWSSLTALSIIAMGSSRALGTFFSRASPRWSPFLFASAS